MYEDEGRKLDMGLKSCSPFELVRSLDSRRSQDMFVAGLGPALLIVEADFRFCIVSTRLDKNSVAGGLKWGLLRGWGNPNMLIPMRFI